MGKEERNLLEIIKKRRSIRKYKDKKIPDELVKKILEAGRWAPSAANNQPWRFVVVNKKEIIRKLGKNSRYFSVNKHVEDSPLIIVIYTSKRHKWVDLDCGMAAQNMMLEAYSLGIGSCFIGAYRERRIKEILSLSENTRIVGIITFGYPEEILEKEERYRFKLEEITYFNKYSKEKGKLTESLESKFLPLMSRFFKGKNG